MTDDTGKKKFTYYPGCSSQGSATHLDQSLRAVAPDGSRARDDTPARSAGRGHDGRAPNVRRVHIPKGRGRETRPLGIPTRHGTDRPWEPDLRAFEDKVLPGTVRTFRKEPDKRAARGRHGA